MEPQNIILVNRLTWNNKQHLNKLAFKLIWKIFLKFRDCQRGIYFRDTKYVFYISISVKVACWFAQKSGCSCKYCSWIVLSLSNLLYASNFGLTWLVQRTKQKEATLCCFHSRFHITFTAQDNVLQHTTYNTKYTIRFHTFITYLCNISTTKITK
jgi:hypothetical protein